MMKYLKAKNNGKDTNVLIGVSKRKENSKFRGFDKSKLKCFFFFIKLTTLRKIVQSRRTINIIFRLQLY